MKFSLFMNINVTDEKMKGNEHEEIMLSKPFPGKQYSMVKEKHFQNEINYYNTWNGKLTGTKILYDTNKN